MFNADHEFFRLFLRGTGHTIDVIIVSYVIYRLLIFIKGTSAFQMIRGLLLLFIITIVARLLNLVVLDWLVRGFWALSLILAVIVFQPEIRRALMEMGKRRKTRLLIRNEMLDELLRAVADFSKKKTGAIIVLEGEVGLRNYINAGIKIDSDISWELLETIFMPKTPLHDGAVIIRGGTIAAAGCFLPLSKKELPKSVGTRHRAALGITDISDATAIVVSEETGTVSLALQGAMKKNVSTQDLKMILEDYHAKNERNFLARFKSGFHRENIMQYPIEKILALLVGVALWYYVTYTVLS